MLVANVPSIGLEEEDVTFGPSIPEVPEDAMVMVPENPGRMFNAPAPPAATPQLIACSDIVAVAPLEQVTVGAALVKFQPAGADMVTRLI
jgi:hypothetical protein